MWETEATMDEEVKNNSNRTERAISKGGGGVGEGSTVLLEIRDSR